jgi:hypothetical protein
MYKKCTKDWGKVNSSDLLEPYIQVISKQKHKEARLCKC